MLCGILQRPGASPAPATHAAPLQDGPSAQRPTGFGNGEEGADPPAAASSPVGCALVPAALCPETHSVPLPQLGCAVFLGGHLALKMLVFLEGLQSALKRKRLAEEDARMTEQREKCKKKGKKAGGTKEEEDGGAAQASSMGMAGQEEREADAFAELAENGLLYGQRSFLDRIKPLVFSCLLDPALRRNPMLRRCGAISLCKFMAVSKRFCEENLQILFSLLFPKERDAAGAAAAGAPGALFEDLTLRQSLLVAVGDLLFRHPNVVEPWTGRLYATLSGAAAEGPEGAAAAELRLTALLVLTHLVLNDMMKPRAVLLVRALWLTACTHAPTARVAHILFQELSKRSTNVVYNLLPEIIARLPEHQVSAGQVDGGAEGRVHYIMQFVEKEKHIEGLIEKLTLRLEQTANAAGVASPGASAPVTDDAEAGGDILDDTAPPVRWRETISCLSHALGAMSYTDRCILRLHDAVVVRKALHTALSYHQVARECLLGVVDRARRPRPGREKGAAEAAAGPEPEASSVANEAGAKGGAGAAAAAALDAIEQTVTGLARGQAEAEPPKPITDDVAAATATVTATPASTPSLQGRGGISKHGKGGKRKAEASASRDADLDNPGFDDDIDERGHGKKCGRGRGHGRGRGRGRAAVDEKENRPESASWRRATENATFSGSAAKAPSTSGAMERKRRRTARNSNDDHCEE